MKKILGLFLSLIILLGIGSMALAAPGNEPVNPLAVVYNNTISTTEPQFKSTYFACVSGNGNSLRYWFNNTGSSPCTVQLFKKTILGGAATGSSFTVAAGNNAYAVYRNPGSSTYYLVVTSTTGAGISGTLRANQLDLVSS